MKNINYFWGLLAVMMAAIMSVGFVSCSSDDDDGSSTIEDYSKFISGTWHADIDDAESCELIIDFQGKGGIFFSDLINQDEGVTAKGSYILKDNKITAVYNNVSVYTESGTKTFNGFTDGVTKMETYTITSCNRSKMVLKDSNGTMLTYKKEGESIEDEGTEDSNNGTIENNSVKKEIIGTWLKGDYYYYILQDGNGYYEGSVSYNGISRNSFEWSVEKNIFKIKYSGSSTTYSYEVSIEGEQMNLIEIKKDGSKGNVYTYKRINSIGTTTVNYTKPPFANYVYIDGYYYELSKAKYDTDANLKQIMFFGANEALTPTGVIFTYYTYYGGIDWEDGTYNISSSGKYGTYSAFYFWRKSKYNVDYGTLKISTKNSIKTFDFTLDGGEVVGHFVGI